MLKKQKNMKEQSWFFKSHFLASSRLPEPSSADETAGSDNPLHGSTWDRELQRQEQRRQWRWALQNAAAQYAGGNHG